jgi:hypothetical protein
LFCIALTNFITSINQLTFPNSPSVQTVFNYMCVCGGGEGECFCCVVCVCVRDVVILRIRKDVTLLRSGHMSIVKVRKDIFFSEGKVECSYTEAT